MFLHSAVNTVLVEWISTDLAPFSPLLDLDRVPELLLAGMMSGFELSVISGLSEVLSAVDFSGIPGLLASLEFAEASGMKLAIRGEMYPDPPT